MVSEDVVQSEVGQIECALVNESGYKFNAREAAILRVGLERLKSHLREQWEAERVQELEFLRESDRKNRKLLDMLFQERSGSVWAWVGDGTDDLNSMGDSMDVVIKAGELKVLIEQEQQPLTPIAGPPDLTGVEDDSLFVCFFNDQKNWWSRTAKNLRSYCEHEIEQGLIGCHIPLSAITPTEPEMPKCPWCGDTATAEHIGSPLNSGDLFVLMCSETACGWHSESFKTDADAIAAGKVGG